MPQHCQHNAHIYYLRFDNLQIRSDFIQYMKEHNIMCVFHYIPLHSSPAGQKVGRVSGPMDITDKVSDTLVRLPLYYGMDQQVQTRIIKTVCKFLEKLK